MHIPELCRNWFPNRTFQPVGCIHSRKGTFWSHDLDLVCPRLAAWHSGRTPVFDRRTFPISRSTCSLRVTTYVGKLSAIGPPTRPTQPFILSGSIYWVVSNFIRMCVGRAIWWVFTRLCRCGYQSLCAVCGSNLAEFNPSVYSYCGSATLRGGCWLMRVIMSSFQ